MAMCVEQDCHREGLEDKGGRCYRHHLKGLSLHMGQLRNSLYPGLTNREAERRQVQEAAAHGIEVERARF